MTGGLCRSCGRVRGKTMFCAVCGANVCWVCLRGTACDVRAPDGFVWSHARAMLVQDENRAKR